MTPTVQRSGLSVQRRVVCCSQQACTVPLDCWSAEINGTLDSQSEVSCSLFSRQPCTVPLDCWSEEITGTLDSQSSGELFSWRPCTMLLDCWSVEITGTLDSQSTESNNLRTMVGAKNLRTVQFRHTLQQTALYLWSISEVLYLSAGLFDSLVWYSAKAKYRPNEVPLGDFNLKIKHKNVDKMSCNHIKRIFSIQRA